VKGLKRVIMLLSIKQLSNLYYNKEPSFPHSSITSQPFSLSAVVLYSKHAKTSFPISSYSGEFELLGFNHKVI
jgi:hypothetical protein